MERRHDKHVGCVLQSAERIARHRLAIERNVCAHLTVVLEIGAALVEQLDPHVARMPKAMVGHLGEAKLKRLAKLLDEAMDAGK